MSENKSIKQWNERFCPTPELAGRQSVDNTVDAQRHRTDNMHRFKNKLTTNLYFSKSAAKFDAVIENKDWLKAVLSWQCRSRATNQGLEITLRHLNMNLWSCLIKYTKTGCSKTQTITMYCYHSYHILTDGHRCIFTAETHNTNVLWHWTFIFIIIVATTSLAYWLLATLPHFFTCHI